MAFARGARRPRRARTPRHIALGEQRDLGGGVDEPVLRLRAHAGEPGDADAVQHALEALQRAVRCGGEGQLIPAVEQFVQALFRFCLAAAKVDRCLRGDLHMAGLCGVHGESADLPHFALAVHELGDGLLVVEEVRLVEGDRRARTVAGRGDAPAGREELVRGLLEVVDRAAQFLGVAEHDDTAAGQHRRDRLHLVDERGDERFHAFDGYALRNGFEHVVGIGNGADKRACTVSDLVRQLHFAARCGPDRVDLVAVGALVGGVELAYRVNLVAEELDAHRVRRRRREDVDEAAAHRELAAVHDQVDARIGVAHELLCCGVERHLPAACENKRCDVADAGDDWLDE